MAEPVGCQIRLGEKLSQQHAIRHILNDRVIAGVVLEADAVAHFTPQLVTHLLRHSLGNTHGSHPSGLGAAHPANLGVPLFMQILGYLRKCTGRKLGKPEGELQADTSVCAHTQTVANGLQTDC